MCDNRLYRELRVGTPDEPGYLSRFTFPCFVSQNLTTTFSQSNAMSATRRYGDALRRRSVAIPPAMHAVSVIALAASPAITLGGRKRSRTVCSPGSGR